jgi:outer membrane protein TolC
MKLKNFILIFVLFGAILFAQPITKKELQPNLYSIKVGVFAKQSSIKKAEKDFSKFDTIAINHKNRVHLYITNIKDKKTAKKILKTEVQSLYKDAYIIKNRFKIKKTTTKNKKVVKKIAQIKKPIITTTNSTTELNSTNISHATIKKKLKKRSQNISTAKDHNKTISLKDAILISLNRSHKILSLREKVIQQKYKVDEKKGAFLPNVTLYSTTGLEYIHTRNDKDSEDKYPKADLQLSVTENIYAGGKHSKELEKERAKLLSETASFREKVEEETLKIIEAYLNLYYQKLSINIENESMLSLKKILNIVEIKEKNGAATKGDLNNIKSKVENASTALVKASSKYQNTLAFYKYFVGDSAYKRVPYQGEFEFPKYTKKRLFRIFEEKNAKLQNNRYKIEAQKFDFEAKKAPFRPSVDLIITGKEKFSKADIDPYRDEKASAVLSLNYNLYKGGSDKARLLNSKSKIAQLQYQYSDILESTKYNLSQLFESINSSNDTLKHIKNEVDANKKALDSYWSAFKYGNQDIQALLLAQRALTRSQQDELQERENYILGYFKLLTQTGELLEYLKLDDFVNPNKF